jgi:hypothetical protein
MSNTYANEPWKKYLKWVGWGLLCFLLLFSGYFWIGVVLFAAGMMMQLVEEAQKAVAKGARSIFRAAGSSHRNPKPSKRNHSSDNTGSQGRNGF